MSVTVSERRKVKRPFVRKMIAKITGKGFDNIKSISEDYDDPKSFRSLDEDIQFTPDLTAVKNGGKHYFEVAMKTDKVQKLVSKWKLMGTLANLKKGKLHLYTPRGHKTFTQKVVINYGINANVIAI